MKGSYRVEIVARAEADLRAIHDVIAQDKPKAASQWLSETLAAAHSLRQLPFRFEIIPEAEEIGIECRHFIRGNYRILYQVDGKRVRVMRVIHAARRLTQSMLRTETS